MTIGAGRYQIVYNGEIYNYLELRAELERRGCAFRTHSDTEVLLHQCALDGAAALQRFNGMFAFAIWDREEQRLFLARDRMTDRTAPHRLPLRLVPERFLGKTGEGHFMPETAFFAQMAVK